MKNKILKEYFVVRAIHTKNGLFCGECRSEDIVIKTITTKDKIVCQTIKCRNCGNILGVVWYKRVTPFYEKYSVLPDNMYIKIDDYDI